MRCRDGSSAARRVCVPRRANSTAHSAFSHSTGPSAPPLWQRAHSACAAACRTSSWSASRSRPCGERAGAERCADRRTQRRPRRPGRQCVSWPGRRRRGPSDALIRLRGMQGRKTWRSGGRLTTATCQARATRLLQHRRGECMQALGPTSHTRAAVPSSAAQSAHSGGPVAASARPGMVRLQPRHFSVPAAAQVWFL